MSGPRYPRLSSHFLSSTPILPHRSSHLLILEAFCDSPFALLQHALPIYRENILLIYQHQVFSLSVYIVTSTFLLILLYSMSCLFTPLIGCFAEFKRFKVVILQRAQRGAIWKVAQSPAEGANNPPRRRWVTHWKTVAPLCPIYLVPSPLLTFPTSQNTASWNEQLQQLLSTAMATKLKE